MLILGFTLFFFLFWQISYFLQPIPSNFVILLVVIFLIWIIYGMFRRSKERKKRIADLQVFAAANGWTCIPRAYVSNFPNWRSYPILNRSGNKIRPFLHREYDNGQIALFDFTYSERQGKATIDYTQTILAFQSPHLNLPFFALAQETIGSKLGELFGYRDIDFDSHPRFSQKYHLAGKDEMQIRTIFEPIILDYLETLPYLQIDAGSDSMFVYYHASVIPVEGLNDYIEMGAKVYNLFRP